MNATKCIVFPLLQKKRKHAQPFFSPIFSHCRSMCSRRRSRCFEIIVRSRPFVTSCKFLLYLKHPNRKANRSSIKSFTGIGDQNALVTDTGRGKELGCLLLQTFIPMKKQPWRQKYVDILQSPFSVQAKFSIGSSRAYWQNMLILKKRQFMSPEAMQFAVQREGKPAMTGNVNRSWNHFWILSGSGG